MIKVAELRVKMSDETLDVESTGDKYSYFYLIDENDQLIEYYDYLNIEGEVRMDVKIIGNEKYIRFFPRIGAEYLIYDECYHIIKGEVKHENNYTRKN